MSEKNFRGDLDLIKQLQDHDNLLDEMEHRRRELPEQLSQYRNALEKAETDLKSFDDKIGEKESARKQLEKDVKLQEERIQKSNEKLMNIRTNEEYQAALKEIWQAKENNKKREDEILEFMEAIESLQAERTALEKAVEEKKGDLAVHEKEIEAKMKEAEEACDGFEDKRKNIVVRIEDKGLKNTYESVENDSSAVAQIYKEFCTACRMSIPFQLFNLVRTMKKFCQCPNCFRILYWHPDAVPPEKEENGNDKDKGKQKEKAEAEAPAKE